MMRGRSYSLFLILLIALGMRGRSYSLFLILLIALGAFPYKAGAATQQWSPEQAREWYAKQPWLVGCNFGPSTAINQLEMFQADSFDVETIDRELGWAQDLGFNSVRVYLHDLLWEQDSEGFLQRLDKFLDLADKRGIGVMFVLFDSVWDPHPKLGKQRDPIPHLHNSGWVQSPGAEVLKDPQRVAKLEAYVKGVVGHFKDDKRVHMWDIINEPDNTNDNSYGPKSKDNQEPADKKELALALMRKAFVWARETDPSQPLTSAVWLGGHRADPARLIPTETFQLQNSDVITFHAYDDLNAVKDWVKNLKAYNRPIVCTEYMARPRGSTFQAILPYFKEQKIGAYNWGFVAGKTQTIYPWDSWQEKYTAEPEEWFHDIFRADGRPYREDEVETIKRLTGKSKQ